jgi:hypothetical protein
MTAFGDVLRNQKPSNWNSDILLSPQAQKVSQSPFCEVTGDMAMSEAAALIAERRSIREPAQRPFSAPSGGRTPIRHEPLPLTAASMLRPHSANPTLTKIYDPFQGNFSPSSSLVPILTGLKELRQHRHRLQVQIQ